MADTDFRSQYDTTGFSRRLRVLCLRAIETGKADVDAQTLWLLSAILKKPLWYFYPPFARENMTAEEMGELEHELLMHFIAIRWEELQKLAIDLVRVIEKFDPLELVIKHPSFKND